MRASSGALASYNLVVHAAVPLSRADITNKLRFGEPGALVKCQVEHLIGIVSHLEDVDRVDELCEAFRAQEPAIA